MPIITTAEVVTRLRITGSDYNTYLSAIIPDVQEFVMNLCNNRFHQKTVYISASSIACVKGAPDTIADSNSKFVEAYFAAGMDIDIQDTLNNNSIKVIATVAAGTLTLTSTNELIDEVEGLTTVTITRVVFPVGIKLAVAKLIKYYIETNSILATDKDIKSVRIGEFEETYSDGFANTEFPQSLLSEFSPWMRVGLV